MDPDTNVVERLIRSFVIGRGNWALHGSQAGATASANLYSLVMTCRINNIDPLGWQLRRRRLLCACTGARRTLKLDPISKLPQ